MIDISFSDRVLAWAEVAGRNNLPWQQQPSAYRVWVSEIMLQQTQVDTVIPYFEKFMQRFPQVEDLAAAAQDEVLHYWSGLGYYARARNMHQTARQLCNSYRGEFPQDIDRVMALPGIGRSTAAAILSLSYDLRHTILDGNVKRVLARHSGTYGWPGQAKIEKVLWRIAEQHTPATHNRRYTQAMMDLGATLCTRKRPQCEHCPVQADCFAYAHQEQQQLPSPRPKKTHPERYTVMLIVRAPRQHVLMQRRPDRGIWGGLLGFPEFTDIESAMQWSHTRFNHALDDYSEYPLLRHVFSHFSLTIQAVSVTIKTPNLWVMEGDQWVWYKHCETQAGLAAPVHDLLIQTFE